MERQPISKVPELTSLWETAWNVLERKIGERVTDGRLHLFAGNRFIEIESTWDGDRLESIAVRSWQAPRCPDSTTLDVEAELFVKNPGLETLEGQSLEEQFSRGEVSLAWVSAMEKALKSI